MPGSQKAATCFKAVLFANSNETLCRREALFHDSPPFSFYIIYASSQDTQAFSCTTHRDNIDIPLIDISILNVNTDTSSACTRTHTGGAGD